MPLLQADRELSGNVGAVLWRAPEIFSGEPYGTSADVYRYTTMSCCVYSALTNFDFSTSFGIVMWEVAARAVPYEETNFGWIDEVSSSIRSGRRPTITDSVRNFKRDYTILMTECWSGDPEERPGFTEISQQLSNMLPISDVAQRENDWPELETTV